MTTPAEPLTFASQLELYLWLTQTAKGRNMLEDCIIPCHVLVVLNGDGYVEVYGNRRARVAMVTRPYVEDECATEATLIDEFMESELQDEHRELYSKEHLKAADKARRITPQMLLESREELALIRELRTRASSPATSSGAGTAAAAGKRGRTHCKSTTSPGGR